MNVQISMHVECSVRVFRLPAENSFFIKKRNIGYRTYASSIISSRHHDYYGYVPANVLMIDNIFFYFN